MAMQMPDWIKPGAWGAIAGAVVVAVIAFSAGWVVTSGTAEESAARQAEKAVIAALTPICVAQFKVEPQPQQTTHLAALQKEDSWERSDYVEKQGWATMPGGKTPSDEVAETCAAELLKLAEQSAEKSRGAS
jgi:hypothetical protein